MDLEKDILTTEEDVLIQKVLTNKKTKRKLSIDDDDDNENENEDVEDITTTTEINAPTTTIG